MLNEHVGDVKIVRGALAIKKGFMAKEPRTLRCIVQEIALITQRYDTQLRN